MNTNKPQMIVIVETRCELLNLKELVKDQGLMVSLLLTIKAMHEASL